MLLSLALGTAFVLAQRPEGPGKGRWEVVTPESQGLSTPALERAEEMVITSCCDLVLLP